METYLKIYTYKGESGKEPFPNAQKQIEIYDFTYDAKRMGGAPTISATVMYDTCLDNDWNDNVFVEFNGEKYFLKNTPTSSKSNTDARFKHELNFVSERVMLDNVYFYDVVSADFDDHKPVTNSSKFSFHGDIYQFVERLNESLKASKLDYAIVVDNELTSDEKLLTFDNSFFSNALQEIYNVFELPYYFVGKVIHVGYSSNQITDVLKYGYDSALLSITKQNTNNKIVNRITGVGSSENIPYYYPNDTEKGDLCAIASDANTGLKTSEIKIVNPVLYGKRVDLTVDKNDIRPNSIVSYLSGAGNVKKYWISDNGVDWVNSDAWTYEMKNFVPLDFYIKYEIVIGTAGSFGVEPIVTINDEVRSNTFEVFAYYKHVDNDVDTLTEIEAEDGKFVINTNIVGDYELVIRYRIYYSGVEKYVVSFKNESIGGLPNWYHNGKKINLKDIGIILNGFPEIGDSFYQFRDAKYIENQSSLMPSIYRETLGAERFYNAENDEYLKADGEFYNFNNPFVAGKPKEHIENFEDIKPTIKEATNSDGERIDMFADVAFDLNDSDETVESTDGGSLNYKHPFFFVKLRKMGFNLFDHAIESGEMTIAVTSGSCGACEFVIAVNDDQKNTVQVDEDGNLVRDEDGNVKFDTPQEKQNDTINNEVWIALRKEDSSFGQVMPNSASKLKPVAGDTFVILNILLPKEYILQAEKRLEDALIDYMSKNNDELFTFDVNFSRIYFEENKNVLSQLNENSSVTIEYNNIAYTLYVSSYSYKMSSSQPLPEIKIALSDKLTQTQSALQNTVSQIAMDVVSDSMTSINVLKVGLPYFVRKDIDDIVSGKLRFEKGLNIGNYASGVLGYGATLEKRSDGNTYLEVDYATIRKKATFTEISIQELKHIGGQLILSPAAMVCSRVEDKPDGYYCYFENKDSDGRSIIQEFIAGDQARCQVFNVDGGSRYYWRLVTDVGEDYIVLSKDDYDKSSKDTPKAGDNIVQLGNRDIATRQNAQIISSHGIDAPSIKQYSGINDFTLEGKEVTVLSPSGNKITGQINIQKGSTGAENIKDLPSEVLKAAQVGADNILLNSGFVGDYDSVAVDDMFLSDDEELYSPSLKNWNGSAIVQDEPLSKSGKAAVVGDISQAVKLILRENYTISFFAKGNSLSVRVGGFIKSITLGKSYKKYVYNFKSQSTNSVFVLNGENATIYDLKLERGTIATDWSPSVRDNDKANDGFASIQYLQDAIKNGSTDIIGGLILSNILQVGNYKDNVMQNVTAGVNGCYYEDKSVAFWAGGTLENAINTVKKFTQNQIPTEEDWRNMANFVTTHGGEVFMRGYLNALGISLRGKIETSVEGNKFIIDPEEHLIAAYDQNGDMVFSIDYANSIISMKGEDCSVGNQCFTREFTLSGAGLSFKDNGSRYSHLGAQVLSLEVSGTADVQMLGVSDTAEITRANVAKYSLPYQTPDSEKSDYRLYVDENGFVRALP